MAGRGSLTRFRMKRLSTAAAVVAVLVTSACSSSGSTPSASNGGSTGKVTLSMVVQPFAFKKKNKKKPRPLETGGEETHDQTTVSNDRTV